MVSLTLVLLEWISAIEASTDLICNSLVVQHRRLQPDGAAEFILANSSLSTPIHAKNTWKIFCD
tara:strand:- start:273 stop:464 length:192 start_codon:yes stop_codon:yes gene_type:complete